MRPQTRTTTDTITDAQIEALLREASEAGDTLQIIYCRIALGHTDGETPQEIARAFCAGCISEAEALHAEAVADYEAEHAHDDEEPELEPEVEDDRITEAEIVIGIGRSGRDSEPFRAAWVMLTNRNLTGPEHSHLPDEELLREAVLEARRQGILR